MDGINRWPTGLSSDARLVSSLTLSEAQCRVRVLLPPLAAGVGLRWSGIAEQAGVALDDHVPLSDLLSALGREFDAWHPNGQVSSETVDRILRAVLGETTSSAAKLVFWGVYDEGSKWASLGATGLPILSNGSRWNDGAHLISEVVDVRVLRDFVIERRARFPVAVLPAARDYLIATTGYGDSLYVSGSTDLCAALETEGLECIEVSQDGLLPT